MIGGFPTNASAVLNFLLFPPLGKKKSFHENIDKEESISNKRILELQLRRAFYGNNVGLEIFKAEFHSLEMVSASYHLLVVREHAH